MKIQTVASTCALLISVSSITPAVAESFNNRGEDWVTASPVSTDPAHAPLPLPADGSFAYSWGSGITPSQYQGSSSSSAYSASDQSCYQTSRIGFNQRNAFPMC